jgi:uncharacterized tellurite resistance protein B-like protein
MTSSRRLAFVKVLAAAAWADGTIREDERNRIKVLLNGFVLDEEERREIDRLLARPVGFDEAVQLTKEFATSFSLPGERRRLLREIEAMLGAEHERAEPERELLTHVRAILSSHTPVDGLVDRLRGLFGRTLFARDASPDAADHQARDATFLREILDDRPERDSDLQRICADYCRKATMDDRLHVLEVLFSRAARDGRIDQREADHVRRVANLLWISQPEYLAVRERFRDRFAT